MSSTYVFTITQAGLQAVNHAQTGGPDINITTVKLGSAFNYTPSSAQTTLTGSLLYSGPIFNYSVDSDNQVNYTIYLDQTIGTFSFGEVGLYLADGTLFAITALTQLQEKVAVAGSTPGNVVSFIAKLVLQALAPVITWTPQINNLANVIEIQSVDQLPLATNASNPNAYSIQTGDEYGNITLGLRETGGGLWTFDTHQYPWIYGTVGASSTDTTLYDPTIDSYLIGNVQAGRFIVQFTTGSRQSYCRYIQTAPASGQVTFTSLGGVAPQPGDSYVIYASNVWWLQRLLMQNSNYIQYGLDVGTIQNQYLVTSTTGATGTIVNMQQVRMQTARANTGPSTLNWGGTGPLPVYGPAGALQGGELGAGIFDLVYSTVSSNAVWQLIAQTAGSTQVNDPVSPKQAINLETGDIRYARIAGNPNLNFEVADAIAPKDAVNLEQAEAMFAPINIPIQSDTRYVFSSADGSGLNVAGTLLTSTILTVAQSGKSIFTQGALTVTLPAPAVGLNYKIYGNSAAITISPNQTGAAKFIFPDGSTSSLSINMPADYGAVFDVLCDGVNWRCKTQGSQYILPATSPNQAISLAQGQSIFAGVNGSSNEQFNVANASTATQALSLGQGKALFSPTVGNSNQTFLVAAAAAPNQAVSLGQAQGLFASINGSLTQSFAVASATSPTQAPNLAQADARYAGVNGNTTQAFNVATATVPSQAINLALGDGRYAALSGNSQQAFNVLAATTPVQAVNLGQLQSAIAGLGSPTSSPAPTGNYVSLSQWTSSYVGNPATQVQAYRKAPDGLIMQAASVVVQVPANTIFRQTVTWPINFPNNIAWLWWAFAPQNFPTVGTSLLEVGVAGIYSIAGPYGTQAPFNNCTVYVDNMSQYSGQMQLFIYALGY